MYLRFAEGNFKQSALWSEYPPKCMFSAPKKHMLDSANSLYFSGRSPKPAVF